MDTSRRIALDLAQKGTLTIEQKKMKLDHVQWGKDGCRGIIRLRLAAGK